MRKAFLALVSILSLNLVIVAEWTTTYHFHSDTFAYTAASFGIEKRTQDPFTQLLVSWNSAMPQVGFFRFFLEVFDDKTHRWTTYKMYEWGKGINRSFSAKDSASNAQYTYVRFEGARGRKYKKFRIKVHSIGGADIFLMRHLAVCATDISQFEPENLDTLSIKKGRIYIHGVPTISQHNDMFPDSTGWCSPTSLAQVIEFYSHKSIDLPVLAQSVYDTSLAMHGSWPFNTAQAGVYLPCYICYVARLASIKDLIQLLAHGHPVIVSICSAQALPGAPKAYDKGHLITVVGIDIKRKEIICHDTAEKEVHDMVKHYPLKQFIKAWENRYRLAYVIVPEST